MQKKDMVAATQRPRKRGERRFGFARRVNAVSKAERIVAESKRAWSLSDAIHRAESDKEENK